MSRGETWSRGSQMCRKDISVSFTTAAAPAVGSHEDSCQLFETLSRTLLNGTSGPLLSTLYVLIFNNRWTLPNFPCIGVQPPPLFWMTLSFALSLHWVVLMMLLKWLHRQLWSTLVIHNMLLCWISYWDQGLADKYCLGLALKRISGEEGWGRRCLSMEFPLHPVPWGNRRVSEWQTTCTRTFLWERIMTSSYSLWEVRHHKFWAPGLWVASGAHGSPEIMSKWMSVYIFLGTGHSAQLHVHWMASSQL